MSKKSNFLINFTEKNNQPGHIENPGQKVNPKFQNCYNFLFDNFSISLRFTNNAFFVKSNDENIIILLSGNIYQDDLYENSSTEKYLLSKYLKYKKDFIKHLNGSFCLFFAQKDSGEIYFATDRLNTRKIFKFQKGKKLIFSTDINFLPLHECKISPAGAASYLINGIMLNDLTIFDEIIKLDRASLHKIVDSKIISEKYWDYNFTNEYSNKSEAELTDELHELYLKSLNKIIAGKKNIFISLSGGYDSRGIAAMLKNITKGSTDIICYSHNFGNDNRNTDSDIASQIAENLGYKFKLLNSYTGNPFQTLKNNAELGNGLAGFNKESDGWRQIHKDLEKSENSILLTGDMYDGTYVAFHGNIKRALEKARICEPSFLKEYKNYIRTETFNNIFECWDNEYNKIINKVSVYSNMVDLLDYLYMDQLIPNLYSIARECFQSPFIETAFPYYDNDILDFIQKIPSELRDRKKLHKLTLEKNYPGIFRIKFPSEKWGKEPVWTNEIKLFSSVFINNINNHKSKLDCIIPPAAIIDSILSLKETNKDKHKGKTILRLFHNNIKKIIPSYHRIVEILPGGKEITRIAGKYVNPRISNPLIKIIILRLYLSRN